MEEKYNKLINSFASKPFHVSINDVDKVWYYLSHGVDKGLIYNSVFHHNRCIQCQKNVTKACSLFGPNGYALQLEDLFPAIDLSRKECMKNRGVDPRSTFIVTRKNIEKISPHVMGEDSSGNKYTHLYLHPYDDHITESSVSNRITKSLCNNLWNGTMDTRLNEIITNLQDDSDGCMSDMMYIEGAMKSKDLLRKPFWDYRIKYAKSIQKYAKRFPNGTNWSNMSHVDKLHVRIFALFYGGCYSETDNIGFKSMSQLIDCSKSAYDGGSLVPFMNSRSDPDSYMVMQVSRAIHQNAVTSRFNVSLAWQSTTDLDLWVRTPYGEKISHSNPKSKDEKTFLNFDANSSLDNATMNPVENITISDEICGTYDVYVNNFCTRNKEKLVPFTIVVSIDGELETYEGVWDNTKMKTSGRNTLKKMIYVCTVDITLDLVRKLKPPELSEKQTRRFKSLVDGFSSAFGRIQTKLVCMKSLDGVIYLHDTKESPSERNMRESSSNRNIHTIDSLISGRPLQIMKKKKKRKLQQGVEN